MSHFKFSSVIVIGLTLFFMFPKIPDLKAQKTTIVFKEKKSKKQVSEYSVDEALGIEALPKYLDREYKKKGFNRCAKYKCPNGKFIHIVSQDKIRNIQIVRARNVLQHFLTNLPKSKYGSDKKNIANQMANNEATLVLLNGKDGENRTEVPGQPLYEEEIQVEGHKWYIEQDYDHRDATFEEILHLVHDTGIGVDGKNTFPGALPKYQVEIRAAQKNSLRKKIWGSDRGWIEELRAENSLSQEYLAAVIDSYYGLWGAFDENKGMWGEYAAQKRTDLEKKDPMGAALMDNKFFHSYLTYNARIDADFDGIFSLKFDKNLVYTHHSQYLKDITLTGHKNSSVRVNGFDNHITGNDGENTVIFSGRMAEYKIVKKRSEVLVTDKKENRDGANSLMKIEKIKFADKTVKASK